jgi:hypothetical protein
VPPSKKKKTSSAARPASAGRGGKVSGSGKKSPSPKLQITTKSKKNDAKSEKKPLGKKGATVAKSAREKSAPAKKGLAKTKTKSAPPTKPKPKLAQASVAKPSVAKIAPPAKPKNENGKGPLTKKGNVTFAAAKSAASKHSIKAPTPVPTKPAAPAISRPMAARKPAPPPPPKKSGTSPEIVAKIRSVQAEKELRKDLAQTPPKKTLTPITAVPPAIKGEDRIVLMVRDPYWLHAHWDVTRQTVDRAKAALVEQWHSVRPILRLLKLDDSGTTESAENIYRDIEIHGGVRNWYIDVDQPPSRFRIVMGYMTGNGRFFELVRSNTVTTPVPGGKEASDDHWADIAKDAERIYAMSGGYGDETQRGELGDVFEERLNRTMDLDVLSQFGSGAEGGLKRARQFHFDVDAELIVFGSTHPDAHVSVGTEPVKVRSDGTFSIRLPFPDRRQVLPATARSRDGVDEQTVVIAVERNTKVMEPLSLEADEQ